MPSEKGKLVVVDGPSGSGKDTLMGRLVGELQKRNLPVFSFSEDEVDDTRGEILEARRIGREKGGTGDKEMADVLIQHRSDIYQKLVQPKLDEGWLVVANRGETATLAYQTVRGELTMDQIWNEHRKAGIVIPDCVVLTTCDVRIAVTRESEDRESSLVRRERESGEGLSGKVTEEKGASSEEKLERRKSIHDQYQKARFFLVDRGVPVLSLDTEHITIDQEVGNTLAFLGIE